MSEETDRLRAELATAEKAEELALAKEAYYASKSEEDLAKVKALKDEVVAARTEAKKGRVAGTVVDGEGTAVTPETVNAAVTTVAGQGGKA